MFFFSLFLLPSSLILMDMIVVNNLLFLVFFSSSSTNRMESVLASRDSKVKLAALVLTYVQTNVLVMDLVK